jgi:glycosyltransferase involved in cell wall biosynthesis
VTDCLVKGLSELGHEVLYRLPNGAEEALPEGVRLASETVGEEAADILHLQDISIAEIVEEPEKPWVKTVHVDLKMRGRDHLLRDNWVFVSQTLARSYGRDRYVYNGVDPAEYIYAETKNDYLLFMCSLDRATEKGLEIALSLSEKLGFELIIAGSASDGRVMKIIVERCRRKNVRLVGEVQGERKAEWLAGAKALLFPTQLNEAFGLVMVEALMSGTPVICSNQGACPELISAGVGFVCESLNDYAEAISRIEEISPAACLDKALTDYHYLRMAKDYLKEYEREIENSRPG